MRPTVDHEIIQRIDPRSLSPHRGYIQSLLAPVQIRHDGLPAATVYGTIVFDAILIATLAGAVARRLTTRRSAFDLVRYASPWQGLDEDWRQAESTRDLVEDESFTEYIHDRLIEFERLRGRILSPMDNSGHPSLSLLTVILSTLESLEDLKGPRWARMGIECWPVGTTIPRGYLTSESRPPHSTRDMFTYCYRVYDVEFALDILPETHVNAFTNTLLTRAADRGVTIDDLLDKDKNPILSTSSACAEALVRGILKISQVVPFVKRRIADKRSQRVAITPACISAGLLTLIQKEFQKFVRIDRDFTEAELTEIALQATIHPDNPRRIAIIIAAVASEIPDDPDILIRHGRVVVTKSVSRREGISV